MLMVRQILLKIWYGTVQRNQAQLWANDPLFLLTKYVECNVMLTSYDKYSVQDLKRKWTMESCTMPHVTLRNVGPVSYTHLTLPTNREV